MLIDRMLDILGILFGPKSKTCSQIIKRKKNLYNKTPPWCFFSIVCKSETLDFSLRQNQEDDIIKIILSIQRFLLSPFLKWTESAIIAKRGWMKLSHDAQKQGMTRSELLMYHAKRISMIDNGEIIRSTRSLWNKERQINHNQHLNIAIPSNQCVLYKETLNGT